MAKASSFLLRCDQDQLESWRSAAARHGVPMSEWARAALSQAAEAPSPSEPNPVKVPRPRPPRVPVNAEGVIAAPAREIPLPPSKRRSKAPVLESLDAPVLSKCEFAPKVELPVPDDAALNALPPEPEYGLIEDGEPPLPVGLPDEMPEVDAHGEILEGPVMVPKQDPLSVPTFSERPTAIDLIPVPAGQTVPPRERRTGFSSPKCASDKCERLQSPTCDACRKANAGGIVSNDTPPPSQPKAWKAGKRSPTCITAKCGQLGAACCEPCRKFNARGFREIEF